MTKEAKLRMIELPETKYFPNKLAKNWSVFLPIFWSFYQFFGLFAIFLG